MIYNEHQKHKYKLVLPVIVLGFILIYALFRTPLLAGIGGIMNSMNNLLGRLTFKEGQNIIGGGTAPVFQELLLVCLMFIMFAYAMKLLEYLIFKIKV